MEPLKFNVARQQYQEVILEDAAGNQTTWALREMLSSDRDKYLNQLAKRMRFTPEGKPAGITNFEGLHGELLSRCMFRVAPGTPEHDKPVDPKDVAKWPVTASAAIYKAVQAINRVTDTDEDLEAKND